MDIIEKCNSSLQEIYSTMGGKDITTCQWIKSRAKAILFASMAFIAVFILWSECMWLKWRNYVHK